MLWVTLWIYLVTSYWLNVYASSNKEQTLFLQSLAGCKLFLSFHFLVSWLIVSTLGLLSKNLDKHKYGLAIVIFDIDENLSKRKLIFTRDMFSTFVLFYVVGGGRC